LNVYTLTKKLGIVISIYTNGTLITTRIADYLKKWRPFLIEITLYGATVKTYERITGIPGSFKHYLRGIKLLKERKIPLAVKTVIIKESLSEFYSIRRLAKQLNTPFRFSTVIDAKLDGSKDPYKHRFSISDGVKPEMANKEFKNKWKNRSKNVENQKKEKIFIYIIVTEDFIPFA